MGFGPATSNSRKKSLFSVGRTLTWLALHTPLILLAAGCGSEPDLTISSFGTTTPRVTVELAVTQERPHPRLVESSDGSALLFLPQSLVGIKSQVAVRTLDASTSVRIPDGYSNPFRAIVVDFLLVEDSTSGNRSPEFLTLSVRVDSHFVDLDSVPARLTVLQYDDLTRNWSELDWSTDFPWIRVQTQLDTLGLLVITESLETSGNEKKEPAESISPPREENQNVGLGEESDPIPSGHLGFPLVEVTTPGFAEAPNPEESTGLTYTWIPVPTPTLIPEAQPIPSPTVTPRPAATATQPLVPGQRPTPTSVPLATPLPVLLASPQPVPSLPPRPSPLPVPTQTPIPNTICLSTDGRCSLSMISFTCLSAYSC